MAQQTQKSYADAILSAYGRGTQYSSYLGDTQASVLAAGARSQADLENTYQAQILDYVARQQADQQQIQLDLEKFNRQLMLEQQKLALAQKEAAAKREQLAYQIAQAKAR